MQLRANTIWDHTEQVAIYDKADNLSAPKDQVSMVQLASNLRHCSSMATRIMSHLSSLYKTAWNCFVVTLWPINAVDCSTVCRRMFA